MYVRWLIILCTIILGAFVGSFYGLWEMMWEGDLSKISFLIIAIFTGTSLWIGFNAFNRTNEKTQATSDFVASLLPALGLIGTVIGFMIVFGGNELINLDIKQTNEVKNLMSRLTIGLGSALWTTLTGLVCSVLLRIQKKVVGHEV